MPRSSGTMTLVSGNPVVTGTAISSTVHNNTMNDIANEITNSIARDGTSPPTANLPMGNFKHTGCADGTVSTDSATVGQVILKNGANAATANLPMGGFKHTNCANGTDDTDSATVGQVGDVAAAKTHAAATKATPVDADELPLVDSEASFVLKRLTFANLKAAILGAITGVPSGTIIDFAGLFAPSGYLACPLVATNISRSTYAALWTALHTESTVTISIATPGVITWNSHGLENGNPIVFSTTGALPTGFTAGTTYYIVNAATNTFQLAATVGGAAINTSGTQSGVHTAICAPWGIGDGSTTFGMPYYPANYAGVQYDPATAGSGVGTQTVGVSISHTHTFSYASSPGAGTGITNSSGASGSITPTQSMTPVGGSANLAAGVRVKKCVKY